MIRRIVLAIIIATPAWATQLPIPLNQLTIPQQSSANAVSNYAFKPSADQTTAATGNAKALYSMTVNTGASAGFVMVFDATTIPSNGAVSPCGGAQAAPCVMWCFNAAANSSTAVQWQSPIQATTGILAAFSTGANCDTITASATASFKGQAI